MRVLSGRLKAVLVATLATIVLVGSHRTGDHAGRQPARSGALHVRHGPGRIRRELHRPEPARRAPTASTRSCPRTGRPGRRRYLGNSQCQADAGQPGDRGGRQVPQPLPRTRELAPRGLLVADRLEPDHRLVDLRDPLRQQGHDHLPRRGGPARGPRCQLDPPLLGEELEDHLQRRRGGRRAIRAYAGDAASTRPRPAPPRRSRSAARRSSGTAPSGRPAARPGS